MPTSNPVEALPIHDLNALRSAIQVLMALKVESSEIEALLKEAKAPPAARLEALVVMARPSNPMQCANALSKAAERDDLWSGLPSACKRWGVHPASLVALETRRPLALGIDLGLSEEWVRSFPAKRRADKSKGIWAPSPHFLEESLPDDLALRELVLADQPRLTHLPDRLWVNNRLTLDRLPNLCSLGPSLTNFEGELNLRNCLKLPGLPVLRKLTSLLVDGQPWAEFPVAPLEACQIRLHRMLNLESIEPSLKARKLTLTLCPRLRELPRLPNLQEAPPEPKPTNRRMSEADSWMPNISSSQYGVTLTACHALRDLPPGFRVPGTLTLQDCWGFESLPPDLEVRHLVLRRLMSLRHLPAGLHVQGHLILDGLGNLESLPRGLRVDGDLVLHQTLLLQAPPDDLVVRGKIRLHPPGDALAWPNRPKVFPNLKMLDYL